MRWLFIYGLVNECDKSTRHTHIGCTESSKIIRRIQQHNGLIPGGPPETKRADGYWKLMFYLVVPPYRNYSSSEIKKEGKNKRGWQSKCKRSLEMAIERGLEFRISREALDEKSRYFAKDINSLLISHAEKIGKNVSDFYIDDSEIKDLEHLKEKKTKRKNQTNKEKNTKKQKVV